jgi:type II secretion system protein I
MTVDKARGMSLLESIVALAILAATAAVIAQMMEIGTRSALRARDTTAAQLACHNVMHELLAGIRPWQTASTAQPVDAWSEWTYTATIEPTGMGNLVQLTVSVAPRRDAQRADRGAQVDTTNNPPPSAGDGNMSPAVASQGARSSVYHLTRWVRRESAVQSFDRPSGSEHLLSLER